MLQIEVGYKQLKIHLSYKQSKTNFDVIHVWSKCWNVFVPKIFKKKKLKNFLLKKLN